MSYGHKDAFTKKWPGFLPQAWSILRVWSGTNWVLYDLVLATTYEVNWEYFPDILSSLTIQVSLQIRPCKLLKKWIFVCRVNFEKRQNFPEYLVSTGSRFYLPSPLEIEPLNSIIKPSMHSLPQKWCDKVVPSRIFQIHLRIDDPSLFLIYFYLVNLTSH